MLSHFIATLKSVRPGYVFKTTDYQYLHCIFVLQGKLTFESEGCRSIATRGTVLLLLPGSAFELHCSDIGYRGIGIGARDDAPSLAKAACFTAEPKIMQLAQAIHDEMEQPGDDETGLLEAMAWTYLAQVFRQYRRIEVLGNADRDGAEWARQICRVIEANVYAPATVEEILKHFPLCERQLARHFSKSMGISPKKYQLQRKVGEAKHLLRNSAYSIRSIAMELGYPSAQHFATQFRAMTGLTPSAYREQDKLISDNEEGVP